MRHPFFAWGLAAALCVAPFSWGGDDGADSVFQENPPSEPEPAPVPKRNPSPEPRAAEPVRRPAPAGKNNRLTYVAYQTLLSSYVYGLSIPLAYGVDEPRVLIASPLIAAPLAFGAHLWLSGGMEITDAHLKGMLYMPTLAVYAATALPLAFTGDFHDGYEMGSILGAVTYPLGLWYGYHLGNAHRSNPDQIDAKFRFALGYAFLGFITPALYFEHPDDHTADILRIGLGQSVGFAALGHVVADFYRAGPGVASGAPMGIATHALLGGLAGIEIAALSDAASVRPWAGAAVLGTSLGFTEGVFFFYNGRDSQERSVYSLLGGLGGALMGAGVQLLLYDKHATAYEQKTGWTGYLIGGAWLGYIATYALTSGMVEAVRRSSGDAEAESAHWVFNPLPSMEPVQSRGDWSWRWRIPGYSYRF